MTDDAARYQKAVVAYEAVRAVIPAFGAKGAAIAADKPVLSEIQGALGPCAPPVASNHDRAVCGLVNKACNTHAAIRLLTDAGNADDAMALGRILLENATILRWLLIDPAYRLDLYCISDALYRRRWAEIVKRHFQSKPDLVKQAEEEVDAEVLAVAAFFGDTQHKWAQILHPSAKPQRVNVDAMMKEIAEQGGASDTTFMHDVVYFTQSAYVHSTSSALRAYRHLLKENVFRCDLGPNAFRRDEALERANVCLIQVLRAAAGYLGFADIDAELDAVFSAHIAAPQTEI